MLVNRSGRMARGLAYGTQSPDHKLNVPAGNMSALADDPDHFLRFCQRVDSRITPSLFVSRRLYGDYLEHLLDEADQAADQRVKLTRIVGEVVGIVPEADRKSCRISLADGQAFTVDRVVLAFGHYPPKDPAVADPAFYRSKRYVRDPWAPSALDAVDPSAPVLLLGTGLTTIDIAINLLNRYERPVIHAMSRRGLLPQPHRTSRSPLAHRPAPEFPEDAAHSIRLQLRALRRHVHEASLAGEDWREVMASLRPVTQSLWQRLPEFEKMRFLRHLQPYWDNHRHRVAPEPYGRFQQAMAAGAVNMLAGRAVRYDEDGQGVCVTLRPRGAQADAMLWVGTVINCTGPGSDLNRVDDGLVRQLLADGSIRTDSLGLGLDVADDCAVVDASGNASGVLYYIGPLLKARYWEATAVPELRGFARQLADVLLGGLEEGARNGAMPSVADTGPVVGADAIRFKSGPG